MAPRGLAQPLEKRNDLATCWVSPPPAQGLMHARWPTLVYPKEWDLIAFSLLYSGFKSVQLLSLPCYELPVLPSLRPVTKVVNNPCSVILQIISGSLQR